MEANIPVTNAINMDRMAAGAVNSMPCGPYTVSGSYCSTVAEGATLAELAALTARPDLVEEAKRCQDKMVRALANMHYMLRRYGSDHRRCLHWHKVVNKWGKKLYLAEFKIDAMIDATLGTL